MTTSDEIKTLLNQVYGKADWKRTNKHRKGDYEVRYFQEPKSGIVIETFTHVESRRSIAYNGSKVVFGITQSEHDLIVRFAEPFYMKADIDSAHIVDIFALIDKEMPPYLRLREDDEWVCDAGLHSRDLLVADLVAGGFSFDLDLANDLNEDYGGPVYYQKSVSQSFMEILNSQDDDDDELPESAREMITAPKVIFGIYGDDTSDDGLHVSFATPEQFTRDGHIPDSHLEYVFEKRGLRLPEYLGEDMENSFSVWEAGMDLAHRKPLTITKQQVINDLTTAGFEYSKELDDFLNRA